MVAMQDVQTWLEYMVLVFSSPWYKLLHAALPWRAEAKRVRNGLLGVRQVTLHCMHIALHCMQIAHRTSKQLLQRAT